MADLSAQKGKVVQAAIDAAMRQRDYRVDDGTYVFMYQGVPGSVTRPGESGTGGGEVLAIPAEHPQAGVAPDVVAELKQQFADDLAEEWDAIRSTIDSIVDPWQTIPTESAIEQVETSCDLLVAGLMGSVTQQGTAFSGGGELGADYGRILLESTSFGGGAFDLFKSRYIDEGSQRAARVTALAELLGEAVRAERNVWKTAQEDVDALLEQYRTGFAEVASGGGGDVSLGLKVVGAALAGVALFATAGTGTAIALAGGGIVVGLAQEIAANASEGDKKEARTFDDVSGGLSDMRKSFDAVSDRVYGEEGAIPAGLAANTERVKQNAGLFQLAPAPVTTEKPKELYYDESTMSLAKTFVPNAAATLSAAAATPVSIGDQFLNTLVHDYEAGRRVAGAHSEFSALAYVLGQLLEEFAWDLTRGAENLELALRDLMGLEAKNSKALDALAAEIATEQTHDGREKDQLLEPEPVPVVPPRNKFQQMME